MTPSPGRGADGPTPVPGRFEDRRVLVTGAGSGIGRAIAMRMAAEGAVVVVADRDLAAAHEVAAATGTPTTTAVRLDQADEGSVGAMVTAFDRLDVACINAGVALPPRSLLETTSVEWRHLHGVNLEGAFLVARAVAPLLMSDRGNVVFTGSTSGLRAHPGATAYAASKAGLVGLNRSLALELAPHGVRVNCVCPGGVRTPLLQEVQPDLPLDGDDHTPLGPLAAAEDVAAAVSFLASSDARHVTATELIVDGGHSASVRRG